MPARGLGLILKWPYPPLLGCPVRHEAGACSPTKHRLSRDELNKKSGVALLVQESLNIKAQDPELRPALEPGALGINTEEHCGAASSAPSRAYDALTPPALCSAAGPASSPAPPTQNNQASLVSMPQVSFQ